MKANIIFIIVIAAFTLSACTEKEIVCNPPYILVGSSCCVDINANSICDNDDKTEDTDTANLGAENKSPILDKKAAAEKVALNFARAWESEDWSKLYDLFVAESKDKKSKERFVKIMQRDYDLKGISIRLDKVEIINDTFGYVYFTAFGIADYKPNAMNIWWDGETWEIDSFTGYFDSCDEFMVNCCGNNKCETVEDSILCSMDCAEESIYLNYNKPTKIAPHGKEFLIELHRLTNESKSQGHDSANLTVNDKNFVAEYETNYEIGDNFYLRYILQPPRSSNFIAIVVFNQD